MRKFSIDWHNHKKIFFVYWCICFFYTAFVAIFVQFIFLPYIAPSLHIGGGFMAELDCFTFHRFAVELTEKIRENGSHEWVLVPGVGSGISGIAALFYVLFVPELWVMIPFNAFVHATSGLIIALIAYQIFKNIKISLISSIPFILMPSAALWYSQLHKDGLTFLGWFMVFYSAVLVSSYRSNISLKNILPLVILMLSFGYAAFTAAKPYHAEMFIVFLLVIASLMLLMLLTEFFKHGRISKKEYLPFIVFVAVSVILTNTHASSLKFSDVPASSPSTGADTVSTSYETGSVVNKDLNTLATEYSHTDSARKMSRSEFQNTDDNSEKSFDGGSLQVFLKTTLGFILNKGENIALKISYYRRAYINNAAHADAKSNIDLDVDFNSLTDVIRYLPRALQIGLLAPFPNKWLEKGRVPANTFMKRVALLEMMVVYIGLLGIPFCFCVNKFHRINGLIVLFAGSLTVMLPLLLVMTNVGIIYRVRYGFLMLLVGVGFAGLVNFIFDRKCVTFEENITDS